MTWKEGCEIGSGSLTRCIRRVEPEDMIWTVTD